MAPCTCAITHPRKTIVLTGGPGAGKTAVLELVQRAFCTHVHVLPESASIIFRGGFPRDTTPTLRRAAQRAIFHVQRELESTTEGGDHAAIVCDRGTIDGGAYWMGDGDLWSAVGTTRERELARYDVVLHLRTPSLADGYSNETNPLRTETAAESARIDDRIADVWAGHPRRLFVDAAQDFLTKAQEALALLEAELPPCCRVHGPSAAAVRPPA